MNKPHEPQVPDGSPNIQSFIQIQALSKEFNGFKAIDQVNLDINKGELFAILGGSGCGKSTLLGLIAGLDAPTTGEILINGVEITALDENAMAGVRGSQIGFVFQFFHLVPSLTAFENILVPLEIAGVTGGRKKAERLLEDMGLVGRAHHYPSQLSGGEQQRVAIARTVLKNPKIFFLGNP